MHKNKKEESLIWDRFLHNNGNKFTDDNIYLIWNNWRPFNYPFKLQYYKVETIARKINPCYHRLQTRHLNDKAWLY